MISSDSLRAAGSDALTGALDRESLRFWFDGELRRSLEARRHVIALYLDLDDFRSINHGFGHSAGDEVLRRWVATLTGQLEARDFVARVGGNELVVVLDREEEPDVEAILCAMRRGVREGIQLPNRAVEFSAGIVALDETIGFDTLLVEGERRMFRARHCWRSLFAAERAPQPVVVH
jgi:diguanylate cyclase (GGDEF)-like protein